MSLATALLEAVADPSRPWTFAFIGITFGAELIAGLAIGWLLDEWLDTGHLFLIIGTILGLLVGTFGFFKAAMKANRAAAARAQSLSESDS